MQPRQKLESLLRRLSDPQFAVVWRETYGEMPVGERATLASDFVAEQYDTEIAGWIARAETMLHQSFDPTPKKWLARH